MKKEQKICKELDCPYARVLESEKPKIKTRLNKLTKAMEFIRQAYSFNVQEIMSVMGNLYDYVIQNYPEKAEAFLKECEKEEKLIKKSGKNN